MPAKCFAWRLPFTGLSLAEKHVFSYSWSFYSEKSDLKKKVHLLPRLSSLCFVFLGLWTLLELPVSAGIGTCEKLVFVMKGELKNKCLDIKLHFSFHGCVSKINSAPISSEMGDFLSYALLGFQPSL